MVYNIYNNCTYFIYVHQEFKWLNCLLAGDNGGDTDSFHPSIWDEERERRQQIHFEFNDDVNDKVYYQLWQRFLLEVRWR